MWSWLARLRLEALPDQTFQGFGKEALPFLKALGFHQDRDWFHDNKALYESELRQPLIALIEVASDRFAADGLPFRGARKTSLFRINRDVRFAKEKHPYNTHVSAVLTRDGTKKDTGGVYVHVAPGNCLIATGFWNPSSEQLRAFREQIVDRNQEFLKLEGVLNARGLEWGTDSKLSRPPNGFKHVENAELIDRLKYKSFIVTRHLDDVEIHSDRLLNALIEIGHDILPFLRFVWRAVDPLRKEDGNA